MYKKLETTALKYTVHLIDVFLVCSEYGEENDATKSQK